MTSQITDNGCLSNSLFTTTKKTTAPHYWPFVIRTHRWSVDSQKTSQRCRKRFHYMCSSWYCGFVRIVFVHMPRGLVVEAWSCFMVTPASRENHLSMDRRLQAWTHSFRCSKNTWKVLPRLLNIGRKLSRCEACPWKWFRWFRSGRCVFVRVLFDPEHTWPPASHSSLSHMLNEQSNQVRENKTILSSICR